MLEIYGRIFRRQEQSRPWWWTALVVVGILVGLFLATWIYYYIGTFALWCLKQQPAAQQLPAARLAGILFGALALWIYTNNWRQRLFLSAPIRDLAATPGSAWQVFRIALRMKWWHVVSAPMILFTVALFPWFNDALGRVTESAAWASADDPSWEWTADLLGHFGWLLAGLGSFVTLLLLHGVFSVTAIALNLALSGIGLGGLAPRSGRSGRLLVYTMPFLTGVGVLVFASTLAYWVATPPEPPEPDWWRLGRWCDSALSDGHALLSWIGWFPGVAIGEVLHGLVLSDGPVAASWFTIPCWGVGAALVAAVAFCRGYSIQARSGFDRAIAMAAPADVGRIEQQAFDPDRINGPLERLLVAWLGRMGRAVLRLTTAHAQSGALDRILLRTAAAGCVALALGHAAMWLLPRAMAALLSLYGIELDDLDADVIRGAIAILSIIGLTVYGLMFWGGPRMVRTSIGAKTFSRDAQADGFAGSWSKLFRRFKATTRGDQRYPLSEIHAVGFSDAVLVPTLYVGFGLTATAGVVWLTGLLLGLPVMEMNWAVAIGTPALWELSFLSYIGMAQSYWTHYRRSLLYQIFISLWMGLLLGVGFLGTLALIVTIWVMAHEAGYPYWIPWLGTVNILVVADVAGYMLIRWLYVRRRFDAEYRNPVSLG